MRRLTDLARVLVLGLLLATAVQAQPLRRFALVAGNDEGGANTRPLRFAKDDARKMHELLVRLGGVEPGDARLLLDENAEDFLQVLTRLEARAREARTRGERTSLIVYYSGHAKDDSLRMGDSALSLEALKRRLAAAPVDIRIAILDSCRSGALTRRKGARRAPAFVIDTDARHESRGLVILTSSAADEDSQESDLLGGSYFSHHLASGLMGDADRSGDGQVTLFEAYSHAYARTVADTADSSAGPQHPTFSYDLAGQGDLVLTDARGSNEGMLVPRTAPAGAYYFVNPRGLVVAELHKAADSERRLALAPGTYTVKRRMTDRLRVGEAEVRRGLTTVLDESRLRDTPFSDDPVKGVPPREREPRSYWTLGLTGGHHAFFNAPALESLFPYAPLVGLELGLHDYLREGWSWKFDLALGARDITQAFPDLPGTRYQYTLLTAGTTLVAEWRLGSVHLFIGPRLAYLGMRSDFKDASIPDQQYGMITPGLVAGVRWRLWGGFELTASPRIHYFFYNDDHQQRSLGYWEFLVLVKHRL
ncbi:caspase family protein [Archangium violaceum]|uniref:caspase family protein n=1 Tax=Archangium violaceum TaxID=83451 RepID=UPI00194F7365|nr:caspase family protein [Archangium violaceum]QRN95805.1 caspase family protein [Archangium violaceum]